MEKWKIKVTLQRPFPYRLRSMQLGPVFTAQKIANTRCYPNLFLSALIKIVKVPCCSNVQLVLEKEEDIECNLRGSINVILLPHRDFAKDGHVRHPIPQVSNAPGWLNNFENGFCVFGRKINKTNLRLVHHDHQNISSCDCFYSLHILGKVFDENNKEQEIDETIFIQLIREHKKEKCLEKLRRSPYSKIDLSVIEGAFSHDILDKYNLRKTIQRTERARLYYLTYLTKHYRFRWDSNRKRLSRDLLKKENEGKIRLPRVPFFFL